MLWLYRGVDNMAYQHQLTDDEKVELLRIARATLREYLRTGRIPPGKPHRQSMLDRAGVFVSLHRGTELRGCVGSVRDAAPLYKAIQEMAIAAAARDSRFPQVQLNEVSELTIEISVLGAHRQLRDPSEIEIGIHGVSLAYEDKHGLLLPQVAREQGWNPVEFLDNVCRKAGLAVGTWRSEQCAIEIFTAQVFDEHSHPAPG
jgi:AmmeMemoRadiSam system protein A